jgi:nitrate/TMAO reductase-like tetraheme cytochrome c subunit
MFKKKRQTEELEQENQEIQPKVKKKFNWFKFSIIANIALVVGIGIALSSMAILHQSDTNPKFCATCHNMERYVESYLTSNTMDNVHFQAGVQCKECHNDYDIPAEIESGIKFITGNYDQDMPQRKFGDEVCNQCHISMEYMAAQTDYLRRNPHASHWPDLKCRSCHISHGEQIDYCSQCHDNGGQRLTGQEIFPRVDNPYDEYPDTSQGSSH